MFYADAVTKYEEIVAVEGKTIFNVVNFYITSSSLVFINGIAIPSSDYTYEGTILTMDYGLSIGDRITVMK